MANDYQDFTTGSIPKKLIRFMIPILGALILQAMYSAVDLLIVGRFGTTAGISGVTTGSSIMQTVTFVLAALTVGVTVRIGQFLGEKRNDKIGPLLGTACVFFAIIALVMTVVLLLLARPIAVLMQAPEEALDLTVLYIRICGAGFIFIVFYNFISAIFRGLGDSIMPLVFVGIACVANIFGDLLLVAVFHMNVAGAAIATVGAQALSVVLSLIIIQRRKNVFTLRKEDFRLTGEVKSIVHIGAPLMLQELLTNISFLAICAFVNRMGLEASSGYGIAQKVQSFVMLLPSANMQSMASFVAQNVGAGKETRSRHSMYWGMVICAGIGVFVFLGVILKGDAIASIFSTDAQVIERAYEYMKGFAPEAIVTSVLFSFMGYFNGHSKSAFVMAQGIAQSFLVRLPLSYYMSIRPGANLVGIGIAAPTATIFGIMICFIYYMKQRKVGKN